MPKVVLIVGLPGSGKTKLAKDKYVPMGYTLIDDPSAVKENFDLMRRLTDTTKPDLVVCDPCLCKTLSLQLATALFSFAGYEVDVVFFENNPEKCRKLIELRNDGRTIGCLDGYGYELPEGVETIPIYEPK